jgi:hypothetical protein
MEREKYLSAIHLTEGKYSGYLKNSKKKSPQVILLKVGK